MRKERLALVGVTAALAAATVPVLAGSAPAAEVRPAPKETGHIYINEARNFVFCNQGNVMALVAGNDPRTCSIDVP